jgi:hypothetical protein
VSPTIHHRSGSRAFAFLAAAVTALSAGCTSGGTAERDFRSASASAHHDRDTVRIALIVGGEDIATATLADTPAAREFAAALPVTIEMEDRFGQAKTGRLSEGLMDGDVDRVLDPAAGLIGYWPPDGTLAIVTADLGPSIAAPGLVALGIVDTGLDSVASADDGIEMTFELAG